MQRHRQERVGGQLAQDADQVLAELAPLGPGGLVPLGLAVLALALEKALVAVDGK